MYQGILIRILIISRDTHLAGLSISYQTLRAIAKNSNKFAIRTRWCILQWNQSCNHHNGTRFELWTAWGWHEYQLTLTDHGNLKWLSSLNLSVSKTLTAQSLFAAITRVDPLHHTMKKIVNSVVLTNSKLNTKHRIQATVLTLETHTHLQHLWCYPYPRQDLYRKPLQVDRCTVQIQIHELTYKQWQKDVHTSEVVIPCKSVRPGNHQLPKDYLLRPLSSSAFWTVAEPHGPSVKWGLDQKLDLQKITQKIIWNSYRPSLEVHDLPHWALLPLFEEEKTSAWLNSSASCRHHAWMWPRWGPSAADMQHTVSTLECRKLRSVSDKW